MESSSIVAFSQLQYRKYFSSLPFPEEFSYEFLEELFLDSPILHGAKLALSGNSLIYDSLDRVPCAENETVGLIHGELCQHFPLLILAYSSQTGLQIRLL